MDAQIRKLGIALAVCIGILFAQLNYIQFFAVGRIEDQPGNTREEKRRFNRPRGQIIAADGQVLAFSTENRDDFAFTRTYPSGDLFGPITGYYSFNLGNTGVEQVYDDELSGADPEINLARLSDVFVAREAFGNVELTVSPTVQQVAREQLGEREGSVVALDPRTGAIDAMWSFPSFDPGPLATNDQEAIDIKTVLDASEDRPLRMRAYRNINFPGSTQKVVTATAAVQGNQVSETAPAYPEATRFQFSNSTRFLTNAGPGEPSCGGTLFELLRVSCNTGFAQMGVDLGVPNMVAGAEDFGFNQEPPIDLPGAVASVFPTDLPDPTDDNGPLARASIGQGDVSATPLQMALVAAGIANQGRVMTPHVMARITDQDGEEVETYEPEVWIDDVRPDVADVVRRGMIETAEDGTASGLLIDGMEVGGKTGTAQTATPERSHAWIIGFAGPPGQPPEVAVAVLVEAQPDANTDQSGGDTAAPIARAVMEAVLAERGGR